MASDLFEQLAAIEHERWADWQRHLHSKCKTMAAYKGLIIPAEFVEQWERLIATPYAELSEKEKESDREQVRRYWDLIAKEKITIPDEFWDYPKAGCACWIEVDGHTGIRIGFTSATVGRHEAELDSIADIPAGIEKLIKESHDH